MKKTGDIISFVKSKDYILVNASLGKGSFGKTVLLNDPFIDELLVAKKYEPEIPELKERFFKSFLQEIKIMFKLHHPNVVRIYNYYAYEPLFTGYILMEYIQGTTINKFIEDYDPAVSEISLDAVFIQLVNGFQYLESKGVIHRDIREGNILIDREGIVKIIDFGLGKTFLPKVSTPDSLVDEVNRSGLDALPDEYFSGEYTSQTDMFYLAELFRRLLRINTLLGNFTYLKILEKMLSVKKAERYFTFTEVLDAINKRELSQMSISTSDKSIYKNFTDSILSLVKSYIDQKQFIHDVVEFQRRIDEVIRINCLENEILDNAPLIRTVVACRFKYYINRKVPLMYVSNFGYWYASLSIPSKQLVLDNLIFKLSSIEEESPVPDIPF